MKTIFLRVLAAEDKAKALAIAARMAGTIQGLRFELASEDFAGIPGRPFAYWLPEGLLRLYGKLPQFEVPAQGRETRCGLGTLDDFRFLRLDWETSSASGLWKTYFSGGTFSPFYEDFWLRVNWGTSGREVKVFVEMKVGSASRKVQGEDHYFRPGIVFPRRTRAFSPKCMPGAGVFSTSGQAAFVEPQYLMACLGLLSSSICSSLLTASQGTTPQDAGGTNPQFEVGQIKRLPWPKVSDNDLERLDLLARSAWLLKRSLDTRSETSHAFTIPALLQVIEGSVTEGVAAWLRNVQRIERQLSEVQAEIDERCFDLYGIGENDRRVIVEGFAGQKRFGPALAAGQAVDDGDDAHDRPNEEDGDESQPADERRLVAELVSWALGVAFGRFDVRLATGNRTTPADPEPFDPLPSCSPGMLTGADGAAALRPPDRYLVHFPENGLAPDDLGHESDIVARVRAVFDAVFAERSDTWWNDVAEGLDPAGHNLRSWLRSGFFEFHLRLYSKSRRKAPIYWQFATPSGSYSVWLYYHRASPDTFYAVLNDYVVPKLRHEERSLAILVQQASGSPTGSQAREIARQEALVEELRAFRDELARAAPLWKPNLDDGVVINFAPLWRLVPHHRAWQKECKDCWDKLVAGEYDWAHLAMHLWPERVVPKCAGDRSLAIAHGLEDVFWAEGSDGKWQKRNVDSATLGGIVAERTSSAVKDALRSLLDAPSPSAGRGRSKRSASPRRAASTEAVR